MVFSLLLYLARATGIVYIFAGVGKLFARNNFLTTVQALPFLPIASASITAKILPWLEMLLGILLLIGAFTKHTAWISLILLLTFSLIATIAVIKGMHISCSCFGAASNETLSLKTVARNSLLALLTLPLILSSSVSHFSLDTLFRDFSYSKSGELAVLLLLPITVIGLTVLIVNAQHTLSKVQQ